MLKKNHHLMVVDEYIINTPYKAHQYTSQECIRDVIIFVSTSVDLNTIFMRHHK